MTLLFTDSTVKYTTFLSNYRVPKLPWRADSYKDRKKHSVVESEECSLVFSSNTCMDHGPHLHIPNILFIFQDKFYIINPHPPPSLALTRSAKWSLALRSSHKIVCTLPTHILHTYIQRFHFHQSLQHTGMGYKAHNKSEWRQSIVIQ